MLKYFYFIFVILFSTQSFAISNSSDAFEAKPAAKNISSNKSIRESNKQLIARAQKIMLEQDRIGAMQVLMAGLQKESKNSASYRELVAALDELSEAFVTEQGQSAFELADAMMESKPKEAVDSFNSALKLEKDNVAVLKGLARAQLNAGDCEAADKTVVQTESIYPLSPEVRLLRMQTLDCKKDYMKLATLLSAKDVDLEPIQRYLKRMIAKDLFRKKDYKKGHALLLQWEKEFPDDPELDFWKWQISSLQAEPDRVAAVRYVQGCNNLSQRKRKTLRLDVDLCKGKEAVSSFLKKEGLEPSLPAGGAPNG